jgi:hypothetical protein
MLTGTKARIAAAAFLFACLSGPFPSFAQKSGTLSKTAAAEAPVFRPANPATTSLINARKPDESWIPEDIDRAVPPVAPGVACTLPAVLEGAGQRIKELVQNVDRFTATEVLAQQDINQSGQKGRGVTVKFDYLVSISEARNGWLGVDEIRNRSHSLDLFPSHIATVGTPSLVLIFHPQYISDFRTRCEGLGEWRGQPAWQVRFEQRADRPNHICSFIVNGASYNVNLRGRAWILADSFQVARLETDIMESIPKIRLRLNHETIEYRPVNSPTNNLQLWLPSSAELYMDFRGRRFYRKHSFTNFKIFSVDMQYQTGDPKQSASSQ